ncbi:hypothetical protein [Rothia sp. L_38]|uniref:hypothetical protein n=1 Tax=Rothia sp. L_38 TaxID=3422315 RepID=UPI003D6C34D2
MAEAHSPEKKAAAALAIQEAKKQRHTAEISEIFAGWSDQEPAQDEKKHQTSPSGQSKSPGADETVILAPYDRGLGASRQQARGKGFLRRFLGY